VGRLRTGLRALLSLGGTPHGIAGGFTLGLCLSLVPIPFAGMFVALAAAPLLRMNLPATYVGTAVENPLTGAFFYASELWLGMVLLGHVPPSWAELRTLDASGWFAMLGDLVAPFVLGAAVMMIASVLLAYPFVRWIVGRWRNPLAPAPDERRDPPPP
jgi:uncharacterized protein (DUF2062 family)